MAWHDDSRWKHADVDRTKRWNENLDRMGPEAVTAGLSSHRGSSHSAISLGGEEMTRGFAEEWLNHNARRSKWTERGIGFAAGLVLAIIGWLLKT